MCLSQRSSSHIASISLLFIVALMSVPASSQISVQLTTSATLSPTDIQSMITIIDGYFFNSSAQFPTDIRKFLRMAFHDCMGGCDGSLNFDNPDNGGLPGHANTVTRAYQFSINPSRSSPDVVALFSKLSRADFWVLSSTRALGWGMKNGNSFPSYFSGPNFLYGRNSASTSDSDSYEGPSGFPDGIHNWQVALSKTLQGVPTLSEENLVALLGLHGAGGASFKNSGFSGPWGPISDLNTVNNKFYINLLGYGYPKSVFTQVKATESNFTSPPADFTGEKIEWVHTSGASPAKMMIPTDMQIYLNFTVNSTGGTNQGQYCSQGNNITLQDCSQIDSKYLPLARNAQQAMRYAQSNAIYVNELITAFLNMVKYTNPQTSLQNFSPVWQCVNGVAVCMGDILFTGCGQSTTSC